MKYKQLKGTHCEYDAELWEQLEELYEGGFRMKRAAKKYLSKMTGESEERYRERVSCASFLPYLGAICDDFASSLFTRELSVMPAPIKSEDGEEHCPEIDKFWPEFGSNADLKGNGFSVVLKDAFATAILKQRALIAVDFPPVKGDAPTTLKQEEDSGTNRGYCFELPLEQMTDWEVSSEITRRATLDSAGKHTLDFTVTSFDWVVLRRVVTRRDTPLDPPGMYAIEFKVWRIENGFAVWETWQTEKLEQDKKPKDDDDLKLIGAGKTSFRQIPIVQLEVPVGMWIGNKVGPLVLEHFQQRSALKAAENRCLFALPVIHLGSELGGVGDVLPSEVQQDPNRAEDPAEAYRRKGMMVLGAGDKFLYAEPDGKAFEIVDKQLKDLVDEIYRVAHQMASSVSNTSRALSRSGVSKAADRHQTELILAGYGAIVRDAAERVYTLLSDARNETIRWVARGLDDFANGDRADLIAEAVQVNAVPVPSKTFRKSWLTQLALRLVDVPAETQDQIRKEIDAAVEKQGDLDDLISADGKAPAMNAAMGEEDDEEPEEPDDDTDTEDDSEEDDAA